MSPVVRRPLYLDCCATLNLYATRQFVEVLAANRAHSFRVSEAVIREARYVGRGTDREEVDLSAQVRDGVIQLEHLESDEEAATYVSLAARLGDGESESGALAYHRGGAVATDDAVAIREFSGLNPPVPVVRTSELMKQWAEHGAGQPVELVRDALNAIEERARFSPSALDPLVHWWQRMAA